MSDEKDPNDLDHLFTMLIAAKNSPSQANAVSFVTAAALIDIAKSHRKLVEGQTKLIEMQEATNAIYRAEIKRKDVGPSIDKLYKKAMESIMGSAIGDVEEIGDVICEECIMAHGNHADECPRRSHLTMEELEKLGIKP